LIEFGFCESEQVGGDISFLFKNITKLMAFFINGYTVDIAKFAPGKMWRFGEEKFIAIVLSVGISRMRR
jgi:hypothetical protein